MKIISCLRISFRCNKKNTEGCFLAHDEVYHCQDNSWSFQFSLKTQIVNIDTERDQKLRVSFNNSLKIELL